MSNENRTKTHVVTGEVFTLAELVQYGEGSIVSRTLAENATGTVTLFAFDAGQGLSEHTAPFNAMVQVVDGQGEFIIDGKPLTVDAGQLLIMPADIPHAVRAKQQFKMLLTMLRK